MESRRQRIVSVSRCRIVLITPADLSAEAKRFDLALKVLEKLGGYEIKLATPDADLPVEDGDVHQRLIAEYYVLRTALVRSTGLYIV